MNSLKLEKVKSSISFIISIFFIIFLTGCGIYYVFPENQKNENSVKEVIDGDTILLNNNEKVRLIGINTPEKGQYFYPESKEVLKTMVSKKEVTLEKDVSNRDQYGRLLRYVFLDDTFINLEMVKKGFANAYTYPPDVKYSEQLLKAERFARENNLGLWQKSEIDKISIELNYDAEGNDNNNLNDEYVIMKNISGEQFNIKGWNIKDSATNIYEFEKYIFLPNTNIYLFTGRGEDKGNNFYWGKSQPVWNNDHDTLYLRDSNGHLIDIYDY